MDKNQIHAQLRKLAKTCKHADVTDLQTLAAQIRELEAFNTREVKLLVDAVKADVLEDLSTPAESAVQGLLRERLASRILFESDASYEEARWAVETWAHALTGKAKEVVHAQPARPALKWDTDATGNAPNLSGLPTSAQTPVSGTALPNPAALQATQQPAQPTPSSSRPDLSWDEEDQPSPSLSDLRAGAPPATSASLATRLEAATYPVQPTKKKQVIYWVLGIVVLLIALVGFGIFSFYQSASATAQDAAVTADQFLIAMDREDYDSAYSMLTQETQNGSPESRLADLRQMVGKEHGNALGHGEYVSWNTTYLNGQKIVTLGYIDRFDNGNVPITVVLVGDSDTWQVQAFNYRP